MSTASRTCSLRVEEAYLTPLSSLSHPWRVTSNIASSNSSHSCLKRMVAHSGPRCGAGPRPCPVTGAGGGPHAGRPRGGARGRAASPEVPRLLVLAGQPLEGRAVLQQGLVGGLVSLDDLQL